MCACELHLDFVKYYGYILVSHPLSAMEAPLCWVLILFGLLWNHLMCYSSLLCVTETQIWLLGYPKWQES